MQYNTKSLLCRLNGCLRSLLNVLEKADFYINGSFTQVSIS